MPTNSGNEPIAWEMEVKGPVSLEWKTHYYNADGVPDDPEEAWKDGHEIRNVRPLVYADEVENEQ